MIYLENDDLKAAIQPKGAELQSLVHKNNGLEYMWSGDPNFWGKHSPILFPIIGTLKDDTYFYGGKTYHLPRHGFARDKVFTVEKAGPAEVSFILMQDAASLEVYPFHFELRLIYRLSGSRLSCGYHVANTGTSMLPFSVGGHPAFALPLTHDTVYTDYYLQFNVDEPLARHKLDDGLIGDTVSALPVDKGILDLKQSLFDEDAIVIKHPASSSVKLASAKHEHGLVFDFTGFPFLGLWAAKNANFLCIEPWCGIADSVNHSQQFEDKEGIEKIEAGETWQRIWSVDCF